MYVQPRKLCCCDIQKNSIVICFYLVEDFGHDFLRKVSNIPSIAKGEFV